MKAMIVVKVDSLELPDKLSYFLRDFLGKESKNDYFYAEKLIDYFGVSSSYKDRELLQQLLDFLTEHHLKSPDVLFIR